MWWIFWQWFFYAVGGSFEGSGSLGKQWVTWEAVGGSVGHLGSLPRNLPSRIFPTLSLYSLPCGEEWGDLCDNHWWMKIGGMEADFGIFVVVTKVYQVFRNWRMMSFAFSKFVAQGLEHSMRSWFKKYCVNIVEIFQYMFPKTYSRLCLLLICWFIWLLTRFAQIHLQTILFY